MNVLLVGATGYLGTSIAEELQASGHSVMGTARSEAAAQKLRDAGVTPVPADITNATTLEKDAAAADGVIYSVQYNGENRAVIEGAALRAIADALAGSNKPFIFTSGAWIYGSTGDRVANEESVLNPPSLISHRPFLESIVLGAVSTGVRSIVIRAGDVYGRGGGLPAMWVQSARESGSARFVGDGTSHWPVVHVDDLAKLYVLALEKAPPGAIYNAADATSFTVREMAEAASRGAGKNGAVTPWPLEDARGTFGAFADALALDSRADSSKARKDLGWQTRSTTIIDDLQTGSYVQ
jgi:nucleoside-diphosphate-sugar epimerase